MKQTLFVLAIASLALASCKKDYTCTCKDQTGSGDPDVVLNYTKVKKKDAQASCDAANTTYAVVEYKCTLN